MVYVKKIQDMYNKAKMSIESMYGETKDFII